MPRIVQFLAATMLLVGISICPARVRAETVGQVEMIQGIRTEFIGRWDADKLNAFLQVKSPKFFGVAPAYTPARNAIKLYRITYPSVIPEQGNKPTFASGLLAIPDTDATTFPIFSYQHGTVYGKHQVPSFPDQSMETQLALAQFAGQGYILIGADYFGMGLSDTHEGYMVKASHQQATYDMLVASRVALAQMKITAHKLFIGGWSQGGFVTMAFLEKLEQVGVPVTATATASAPLDVFAALSGYLDFPRKNDADWLSSLFILSTFAFENYYGVPGLAQSVLNDAYYDVSRRAYEKQPFDVAEIPADLRKLIRAEYFDPQFFAASAYGRLIAQNAQAYRWVIKSRVRNYYGEKDEAITPGLGQMAMTWQRAMGSGNTQVSAISTGDTDHRGTYATSIAQWKTWFDGL